MILDIVKNLTLYIWLAVAAVSGTLDTIVKRRPLLGQGSGLAGTAAEGFGEVTVDDVPGNPGWYKVDMKVVPHMKYMGAFFTLSLVGKLDKE